MKINRPIMMIRNVSIQPEITVRSFQLRADTINEEERSVEALIATEEPVLAFDLRLWEPVLEVLRMDGVITPDQSPLLDTHDRSSITKMLGSTRGFNVQDISIDGYTGPGLIARNWYDDDGPQGIGNKAWSLVRGKHLRDNSVGYEVLAYTDVQPGETAMVNGREYTAPESRILRVTTSWRVKENSNCPIGADQFAKMRAENDLPQTATTHNPRVKAHNQQGKRNMTFNKKQLAFLHERGLSEDASQEEVDAFYADSLDDAQRAECDALGKTTAQRSDTQKKAEPADSQRADSADNSDSIRKAVRDEYLELTRAERKRIDTIRSEGKENGVSDEIIDKCIAEDMNIEQARGEFLKSVRTQRPSQSFGAPMVNTGAGVTQSLRHIEAGFMLRAGFADAAEQEYGADITQQADENFRYATFLDSIRTSLILNGHQAPSNPRELVRAGFTTGSLGTILGNTAGKMMLMGYNSASGSWRIWCNIGNLNDFKDHKLLRMNDLGEMEKVGNGGEVNYGERGEDSETININTYAKNLSVTYQDAVNDDLGVFTQIPRMHGIKSGQKISKVVYTHFLSNPTMGDGNSLFDASNHSNLNTTNGLTADNLATAIEAFYAQTGPDGEPVEIPPAYLLVPPQLRNLAKQLVRSQIIMPVGDTDAKFPTLNVAGDDLKDSIAEPRLGNSSYTGYSATSWYLVADPAMADTVMVAFLNGNQNPTLEQFQMGPDRLGMTYRAFIDFGVKATDWRTMQKNTA